MTLKIGTVSKLTGFSPSGIRYYEDKGIISPSHGRNGTYRSFDFEDVALLLECRNLRECGCSTAETVSAITTNNGSESVEALRECGKRLRNEIQRKELLEGFLQQRICALESALAKTKAVLVRESPAFYWTPLWLPDKNEGIEAAIPGEDSGFAIPFADSSLLLSQDIFNANSLSRQSIVETTVGYGIDRKFASAPPEFRSLEFFPAQHSLYTQIEVQEDFSIEASQLAPIADTMRKLDLECCGRPITHRIMTLHDSKPRRFDEIWVPVR